MDGLELQADIVEAVKREQQRIDAGWAPFWHYPGLGMYGRQLADLFDHFPREALRYYPGSDTLVVVLLDDSIADPDDLAELAMRLLRRGRPSTGSHPD